MADALDLLEHEAVGIFETRGLSYARHVPVGGASVHLVVTDGGAVSLALQLRLWPTKPGDHILAYAKREVEHLKASHDVTCARILVPGSGEAPDPLISLDELRQLVSSWSIPAANRAPRRPEKPRNQRVCAFCAMPFHEDFLDVYFLGILPAAQASGIAISRLDQSLSLTEISKRIWEGINRADIVIADISGHNPNVMYEVGLAHGMSVKALILRDGATEIPFDIKDHLAIRYDRNRLHKMQSALTTALSQLFSL